MPSPRRAGWHRYGIHHRLDRCHHHRLRRHVADIRPHSGPPHIRLYSCLCYPDSHRRASVDMDKNATIVQAIASASITLISCRHHSSFGSVTPSPHVAARRRCGSYQRCYHCRRHRRNLRVRLRSAREQVFAHASLLLWLPSSHSSPGSRTPSPQKLNQSGRHVPPSPPAPSHSSPAGVVQCHPQTGNMQALVLLSSLLRLPSSHCSPVSRPRCRRQYQRVLRMR